MDPVVTLKRALEVDLKLWIFCQECNKPKDDAGEAISYSKNVVYEATTKRRKHRDEANREAICRLEDSLGRNDGTCIVWHGNCYAQYASKEKSNVFNKRERQVENFDLQQQLLTVLVKHAVKKKKSSGTKAYFAKTKTKK